MGVGNQFSVLSVLGLSLRTVESESDLPRIQFVKGRSLAEGRDVFGCVGSLGDPTSLSMTGEEDCYSSRWTVFMENAGRQTAMYSAPPSFGVE